MRWGELVDPVDLIGKRVFVTTKKDWFVGTLQGVREYALSIIDWVQVHGYSEESKTINSHGPRGHNAKVIMHSGGVSEMECLELNAYSGDPFPLAETAKEEGDMVMVDDALSFSDESIDVEIPDEVFDTLFPNPSDIVPEWLTKSPQIDDYTAGL